MGQHHDRSFPGESAEYRKARDELLIAEMVLRQQIEAVAQQRRQLPLGGVVTEDYEFDEVLLDSDKPRKVRLSSLFGDGKNTLIVYGFMYGPDWTKPCPNCTSVTDGSNGIASHVRAKTNFVTVAKAPADKLKALAKSRNWTNTRLLSSASNTFNHDYLAEWPGEYGEHHPMMNVFVRRDGNIRHFWASELFFVPMDGAQPRHIDLMWPLWNFLDLTPEGREDFLPRLKD